MLKYQDSNQLRPIFWEWSIEWYFDFDFQRLFDLEKMLFSDTQTQNVFQRLFNGSRYTKSMYQLYIFEIISFFSFWKLFENIQN